MRSAILISALIVGHSISPHTEIPYSLGVMLILYILFMFICDVLDLLR